MGPGMPPGSCRIDPTPAAARDPLGALTACWVVSVLGSSRSGRRATRASTGRQVSAALRGVAAVEADEQSVAPLLRRAVVLCVADIEVPDCERRVGGLLEIARLEESLLVHRVRPRTREAVGLQL